MKRYYHPFIYNTLITHIRDSNNQDQFAKYEEKVQKSCKLLSKIQRVSTLPSKKHMQAFNTMMITRKRVKSELESWPLE
jgi:hypothetical protein